MVFTPPPSPLPPAHPALVLERADGSSQVLLSSPTVKSQGLSSPPTTTIQSQSSSAVYPRVKRRLMVLVVPAILFLVCSTSSFIIHPYARSIFDINLYEPHRDTPLPVISQYSGNFRDWASSPASDAYRLSPPKSDSGSDSGHGLRSTFRNAISKHVHGMRHYGSLGRVPSSFPSSSSEVERRNMFDGIDARTFPKALAAVGAAAGTPTTTTTETAIASLDLSPSATASRVINNDAQTTAPAIPTPAWSLPTPFPQPFDSSLSYNFTTSTCLSFFTTQLANNTFRACRPFGLLFATSTDFFSIESNLTELTAVLEGTCNTVTSEDSCVDVMDWMSTQIVRSDVCMQDLREKNSIALEALYGFRSYDLFRKAGCLVNPRTNAYCFAEALASTSPSDLYYFALPLGTPIPGTNPTTTITSGKTTTTVAAPSTIKTYAPSCSTCVSSLMEIFAPYANDTSLLLGLTYPPAASAAVKQCGTGYAPGPYSVVASPTPPVSAGSSGGAERRVSGQVIVAVGSVLGTVVLAVVMSLRLL